MSKTQCVFCQMEFGRTYTAQELAEHTCQPLPVVYAAMRELHSGGVIERERIKPDKGRGHFVFRSKQTSLA